MSEALRLADALDNAPYSCGCTNEAAAELRRLHAECDALRIECKEMRTQSNASRACVVATQKENERLRAERDRLKAEVHALRAELARLTTWQPMETAPMDGTIVLLAYKNALGKLRRVRASYMTRDLIGEYEDDEIERNPGWYERSESHEDVTETVYPVSYELLCWTPLPALKEAK